MCHLSRHLQEILHYAKLCMGAYSLNPEDAVKDSEHVVKVESVARLVSHNTEGKCPAHVSPPHILPINLLLWVFSDSKWFYSSSKPTSQAKFSLRATNPGKSCSSLRSQFSSCKLLQID